MNDNTKLYVFARKECVLISVFVILMVLTAFIFGVKIGKHYSFEKAGLIDSDRQKVELLSKEEEMVEKMITGEEAKAKNDEELSKEAFKMLKDKINSEFNSEDKRVNPGTDIQMPKKKKIEDVIEAAANKKKVVVENLPNNEKTKRDDLTGKYTIQLGSHRSLSEAKQFADAFKVRGYDPIINEVVLKTRGTWFRVSIGIFDSMADAKDYIKKEQSLFAGQDYVISEFD